MTTAKNTNIVRIGGKIKRLAPDPCYHWCPIGRHDWAHAVLMTQASAPVDKYREPCRECKRKMAAKVAR